MNKNIKFIISGLLLVAISFVGYYILGDKKSENKEARSYNSEASRMLSLPDQERQKWFDSTASGRWYYSNIDEAGKDLPFKFQMPDEKLTGKPTGIYVTKNDKASDRVLLVHYQNGINGITLSAILSLTRPDIEGHVDELTAEIKSGINHSDKVPSVIDLDGTPTFALEPGYNDINGDKVPRPGVLEWWNDGVTYSLYGTRGAEGTSLDQLVDIAKSLNSSKKTILPGVKLSPREQNTQAMDIEPQVDMEKEKQGKIEYEK